MTDGRTDGQTDDVGVIPFFSQLLCSRRHKMMRINMGACVLRCLSISLVNWVKRSIKNSEAVQF